MRIPGKPGLVHLILLTHTMEKVQMLFHSDRRVPERKVWYVPSLVRCVPDLCVPPEPLGQTDLMLVR
jgi:hypothetical protein